MSDLTFRKVDQYTLWQIATEGRPGDGTEPVGTYLIAELPEGAQPGTVDEEVTDVVKLDDADLDQIQRSVFFDRQQEETYYEWERRVASDVLRCASGVVVVPGE